MCHPPYNNRLLPDAQARRKAGRYGSEVGGMHWDISLHAIFKKILKPVEN